MAVRPGDSASAGDDALVAEALATPLTGWDFSWAEGRVHTEPLSWSYEDRATDHLTRAPRVLYVDTGGGELLAVLLARADASTSFVRAVTATEGWPPNVPVAAARLGPLGVVVLEAPSEQLPLADASVDLVLDRHGRLPADEVARVLTAGGTLLTQQVGSDDCTDLNTALGVPPPRAPGSWTAQVAAGALTAAGLVVEDVREEHPVVVFGDAGALVRHLRLVPWQLPGASVADHVDAVRHLCARGPLRVRTHRFLLVAHQPVVP